MPDPTDIVKRLRDNYDPWNLEGESATALETLLAQRAVLVEEVKWLRELDREHKDENPCPDYALRAMYRKKAREARAATDAAFKGGLPK